MILVPRFDRIILRHRGGACNKFYANENRHSNLVSNYSICVVLFLQFKAFSVNTTNTNSLGYNFMCNYSICVVHLFAI